MRIHKLSRFATLLGTFGLVFCSFQASPEDIDIFSVDESSSLNAPNVLIVLDNTSNWSRASQQWPEGEDQGQSEVAAIKTVINELDAGINVGLMEYVTGGSSGDTDFGFVRAHIRPMTAANKAILSGHMDTIYSNINEPSEKRSSSNPYGNLFWDVYNYLAGADQANGGAGTPASADPSAYDVSYSNFRSPLTSNDTCTRTIVIFIGNNVNGAITADSAANVTALRTLATNATDPPDAANGDVAVAQIPHADYVVTTGNQQAALGLSSVCYSSAAACTTAENDAACAEDGFTSCVCDAAASVACPSTHWNVVGTTNTSSTVTVSDDAPGVDTSDQSTGETKTCAKADSGQENVACSVPPGTTTQVFANTPVAGQTTTTYTSWVTGSCKWVNSEIRGSCNGVFKEWDRQGTRRVRTKVETITSSSSTSSLGETTACYNDAVTCNPADVAGGCPAGTYNGGCACTTAASTTGCGAGNTSRFQVKGNFTVTAATQTGTFSAAPDGPLMMDEWARFMKQTGVTVPGVSVKNQVTTYTIDTFNAQQSPELSGLWFNAARVGGGKYFQAKDKQAILNALRQIFTEVQAVNSAFSSASLPVNATNRAQNENQVFIGVFKPDRVKEPLWFGNLKRYQLISSGASIDLGDSNGNSAINNQTGFITDCATSYWTTDTGPFWNTIITDDPDAIGICASNSTSDWSDLPDGPFVEKGAIAEVLRKGNGDATQDAYRNYSVNRNMKTVVGGALVDFDTTNLPALDEGTVNFIRGEDVDAFDFNGDGTSSPVVTTKTRSTIHGDVVHSRPQPINHGGSTGVVVYYGSNDGVYHAVRARAPTDTPAGTPKELWSFVAPEHFDKLDRLRKNDPLILYHGDSLASGAQRKDYFFDGSTGVFQNKDDSEIFIFPSMRRGGRKIYGFDVTDPEAPKYMWSAGCPNLLDDTGCDTGYTKIGQTWGLPNVALLKGYCGDGIPCLDATTKREPVIVLSGGYDDCEDANTWTPSCSSSKGTGVYVIDAKTGKLQRFFDFSTLSGFGARSTPADVALIDIDSDAMVDYGYAVDTGGNVYRFDFIDGPTTKVAYDDPADWTFSRIAYTNGGGRKFLFPPALVQITSTKVYLAVGSGDREHPLQSHYPYDERDGDNPTSATDDDYDLIAGNDATDDPGVVNRFYVFKDNLADVDATTSLNLDGSSMSDFTTDAGCGTDPVLPADIEQGWFINLGEAGPGEQVVTSAVVAAGFVFFSTNRPTDVSTVACATSLGEARGYFVNLLNGSGAVGVTGACGGSRSSTFVGGGLPPSPVLATVPIGGELRTVVIGAVQKTGEPSSPIEAQRVRPPIPSDRKPIYWYKSTGDK